MFVSISHPHANSGTTYTIDAIDVFYVGKPSIVSVHSFSILPAVLFAIPVAFIAHSLAILVFCAIFFFGKKPEYRYKVIFYDGTSLHLATSKKDYDWLVQASEIALRERQAFCNQYYKEPQS